MSSRRLLCRQVCSFRLYPGSVRLDGRPVLGEVCLEAQASAGI